MLAPIEERIAALETEVAAIKQSIQTKPPAGWLASVVGSMKDSPDFDEILRLGQEWRASHRDDDVAGP